MHCLRPLSQKPHRLLRSTLQVLPLKQPLPVCCLRLPWFYVYTLDVHEHIGKHIMTIDKHRQTELNRSPLRWENTHVIQLYQNILQMCKAMHDISLFKGIVFYLYSFIYLYLSIHLVYWSYQLRCLNTSQYKSLKVFSCYCLLLRSIVQCSSRHDLPATLNSCLSTSRMPDFAKQRSSAQKRRQRTEWAPQQISPLNGRHWKNKTKTSTVIAEIFKTCSNLVKHLRNLPPCRQTLLQRLSRLPFPSWKLRTSPATSRASVSLILHSSPFCLQFRFILALSFPIIICNHGRWAAWGLTCPKAMMKTWQIHANS